MARSWVLDVKDKLREFNTDHGGERWMKRSIYRVPTSLTEINKIAYTPQVVSFGPYHQGEKNLQPMEEHKERALLNILNRTKKPIEDYVGAIREIEQQLKDCYDRLDEKWLGGDGNFLQLMILDGCFMLEVLLTAFRFSNTYPHNDPIFSPLGQLKTVPFIMRDMLLLQNQLPLMLLEKLMKLEDKEAKAGAIDELVVNFFSLTTLPANTPTGLHVIDVYRKAFLQDSASNLPRGVPNESPPNESPLETADFQSATDLHESGIRFKKSRTNSFKDFSFKDGVLTLPAIEVDDTTESTFRNLMAFERLHRDAFNEITSYVIFLSSLLDSPRDVRFLHSKGIIENNVGNDKAVSKIFNDLSKDLVQDPSSDTYGVKAQLYDYCRKTELRAKVRRSYFSLVFTYFRSPWTFLSLLAAIIVLVFTVVQTFYTIYPYYQNSSAPPSPSSSHNPRRHGML